MQEILQKCRGWWHLSDKVLFILNSHNWILIDGQPFLINSSSYYCEKCDLILYWLIFDVRKNKLTCDELIIKNIIE